MRDGTCTKCGAETVHAARNGISNNSSWTELRPHLEPGFRGIVRAHRGEAWQFACTSCGYLEWHVLDPATIEFIARSWGRVAPHPRG
jgi:hypothetical protein